MKILNGLKKNLILRYSYFSLELLDIPFVKFASVVVAILS